MALAYSAWALFCLGDKDGAQIRVEEALAWATTLDHAYSLVIAQNYAAVQAQFLDNVSGCREMAEAASEIATEQGFLRGWAMCSASEMAEQVAEGVELMQESAALYRSTGAKLGACYFGALLAESMLLTEQPQMGQMLIGLAMAQFDETQERWCEAELYRIQGSILRAAEMEDEAAAAFEKALAVAQEQDAGWWIERVKEMM